MSKSFNDIFPQYLSTPRLIMERYDGSAAHDECMLAAMNSPTAHARMGDYGVRTREQFATMNRIARLQGPRFPDGRADGDCFYVVKPRGEGEAGTTLMGGISLMQREVPQARGPAVVMPPDIGWCLLEEYMGQGYATEAARELLRSVTQDVGITDVMVFPSETNRQSNRVAEKLGFVAGGECKDLDHPGHMVSMWVLPHMEKVDGLLKDGISFKLPPTA